MRTLEKIFVNSVVAAINVVLTAIVGIIIYQYAGKVHYWYWWGLAVLLVFGAITYYMITFQNYEKFPFVRYRVKNDIVDGITLRHNNEHFDGREVGEGAWQFVTSVDRGGYAIYGPHLKTTLRAGKYKATFRIKVLRVSHDNYPIAEIDIASATRWDGDKKLAAYTLTSSDFKNADKYYDFPLKFTVADEARKLELRVDAKQAPNDEKRTTVIVDYVQLSRRLF